MEPKTVLCPGCGAENPAGQMRCSTCGENLEALPDQTLPPRRFSAFTIQRAAWIFLSALVLLIGLEQIFNSLVTAGCMLLSSYTIFRFLMLLLIGQ